MEIGLIWFICAAQYVPFLAWIPYDAMDTFTKRALLLLTWWGTNNGLFFWETKHFFAGVTYSSGVSIASRRVVRERRPKNGTSCTEVNRKTTWMMVSQTRAFLKSSWYCIIDSRKGNKYQKSVSWGTEQLCTHFILTRKYSAEKKTLDKLHIQYSFI